MNTADLISWFQKRTGKQVTNDEMRVLINESQNEVFSINTYFNKKKSWKSCLIETEKDILQYSISDTSVRSVERVFIINRFGEREDVAVEVDNAINPGDNVVVYFEEDPGDATDKYYFDGYVWPFNGQITNSTVPLSLPTKHQTELLFFMVSHKLEVDKDGRSIYNDEKKQQWLRDWTTYANQGAAPEPDIPQDRGAV